jgi:hypothetical protein
MVANHEAAARAAELMAMTRPLARHEVLLRGYFDRARSLWGAGEAVAFLRQVHPTSGGVKYQLILLGRSDLMRLLRSGEPDLSGEIDRQLRELAEAGASLLVVYQGADGTPIALGPRELPSGELCWGHGVRTLRGEFMGRASA